MTPTDEQRAVIETEARHVLCLAGAGSGKTAVIAGRVAHLAKEGYRASDIVVMTYTNEAALELRLRTDAVGIGLGYCGTLHGYCMGFLRQFNDFRNTTVIDRDESDERLTRTAAQLGLKVSAKELRRTRQGWRHLQLEPRTKAGIAVASYFRQLRAEGLIDYDSLLAHALERMQTGESPSLPPVALLVDEYQDAGYIDEQIYEAIGAMQTFFVGDTRQAIFSWRNATEKQSLGPRRQYAVFHLTKNFRSVQAICDYANKLAGPPDLVSARGPGMFHVEQRQQQSIEAEAAWIADMVRAPYSDNAVLVRTNRLAEELAERLPVYGVPVKLRRPSAKPPGWRRAMLAVRVLDRANPAQMLEWIRQSGKHDYDRLAKEYAINGVTLGLQEAAMRGVSRKAETIIPDLRWMGVDEECLTRIERLLKTLPRITHSDLLLAMVADPEPEERDIDAVTIATFHSAKGREWPTVILASCNDGVIPNKRSDRAEELRVLYVGVTRAKDRLALSWYDAPSEFLVSTGKALHGAANAA